MLGAQSFAHCPGPSGRRRRRWRGQRRGRRQRRRTGNTTSPAGRCEGWQCSPARGRRCSRPVTHTCVGIRTGLVRTTAQKTKLKARSWCAKEAGWARRTTRVSSLLHAVHNNNAVRGNSVGGAPHHWMSSLRKTRLRRRRSSGVSRFTRPRCSGSSPPCRHGTGRLSSAAEACVGLKGGEAMLEAIKLGQC